MKKQLLTLLCGAALALSATVASAVPINGSIAFSDHFTLNGPFATATAITSLSGVTVSATAGDYSGIANGTAVSFAGVTAGTPFVFSPSTAFAGLWTIISGGNTYSFDVLTTTVVAHTASTIALEGTGTAHITGLTDTTGTWNLTLNANGGLLNFSGGAATVPDGGSTLALMGGAVLGLGIFRRKLTALVS